MEEYYFLFVLALVWTVFAVVQDLRSREVSNWLNFSFIGIALAYRAFYSSFVKDINFFVLGAVGFVVFFGVAHLLYYTKAFAGGDAKLLMGYGIILPYSNLGDLLFVGAGFVFLLFFVGAFWSLIYSFGIVSKDLRKFVVESKRVVGRWKWIFVVDLAILVFALFAFGVDLGLITGIGFFVLSLIFIYVKALDKLMVVWKKPRELMEGDWLEKDVKIKGNVIKKSVHGLNQREISRLKKIGKKVLVKEGIPFTPAFLISLGIMVWLFLVSKVSFSEIFSLLF
tara:strand:+ start:1230 stop:2075 length:846 start_codon:yes stop_codon:yes gene_type:complete